MKSLKFKFAGVSLLAITIIFAMSMSAKVSGQCVNGVCRTPVRTKTAARNVTRMRTRTQTIQTPHLNHSYNGQVMMNRKGIVIGRAISAPVRVTRNVLHEAPVRTTVTKFVKRRPVSRILHRGRRILRWIFR